MGWDISGYETEALCAEANNRLSYYLDGTHIVKILLKQRLGLRSLANSKKSPQHLSRCPDPHNRPFRSLSKGVLCWIRP
jgi:hypothetical protein